MPHAVDYTDYFEQQRTSYQEKIGVDFTGELYRCIILSVLEAGGFYSDNGLWLQCNDRKAIMLPIELRARVFKELLDSGEIRAYSIQANPKDIKCNFDILYPGDISKNGDLFGSVGLYCLPRFKNTLAMTFRHELVEDEFELNQLEEFLKTEHQQRGDCSYVSARPR